MLLPSFAIHSPTWANHRGEHLWNLECASPAVTRSSASPSPCITRCKPSPTHGYCTISKGLPATVLCPVIKGLCLEGSDDYLMSLMWGGMSETTLTTLTEIYMSTTPTKGCELWMPDSNNTILSPVMACTIIVETISISWIFFFPWTKLHTIFPSQIWM